jgi:hypothetical protein
MCKTLDGTLYLMYLGWGAKELKLYVSCLLGLDMGISSSRKKDLWLF